MRLFRFAPEDHRAAFEQAGWVHVRAGLTDEFLDHARRTVAAAMEAEAERLRGQGIAGAKAQFLFDFPEHGHYDELFDVVAGITGLDRGAVTLSERHIKTYEPDADPRPSAHKDRFASRISMGISLEVPAGSHLVLYPDDDVWENPCLDTTLRDTLAADRQPDVVLRDAHEVEVFDEPGDVIVFRGSAMWHLRRNSASTVNVYLKFNDFGCDPLGEDPSTPERRRASEALADDDDRALAAAVPVPARRFDALARQYRRDGWPERLVAQVWGRSVLPISEDEAALVRSVDGARSVADLLAEQPSVELDNVRRLVRGGVLDLVSPAR